MRTPCRLNCPRLWLGIYALSYVSVSIASRELARHLMLFKVAFDISIIGLSVSTSWKLWGRLGGHHWIARCIVCCFAFTITFVTAYLLPWIAPDYYGSIRFGWSPNFNSSFGVFINCVLTVLGIWLICAAFKRHPGRLSKNATAKSGESGGV